MTDSTPDARAAEHPCPDRPPRPDRPQRVGSFRFIVATDEWEWSDAVARMHGYEPGTVHPTTELVLSHKHPDDLAQITEVLNSQRTTGRPFSSRHRIIDTDGNVKQVVVVGDQLLDAAGTVIGTSGFYVDLTDSYADDIRENVDEALSTLAESRAIIEQAKGVLMLVYGISADHAFEILTWRSQETNIKLRALAQRIVDIVAEGSGPRISDSARNEFDHFLMTVHRTVPHPDHSVTRTESGS
ncbi:PAS and ANTAR domain-containing protein [Rhodococcus zopfii]|uniref:PAS and ANTAR domain-containing protein n=1 Tax=Rhodococcus zopfii TaxID=43772 RepID=UPI0009FAAE54|nr:PAS and ANTAR domain-containing protein [Rhodococcus zopfii]